MATRVVTKEKPAARLWVFAPPHRLLSGGSKLADSTVVSYVALGADGALQSGEAPIALLPRSRRLEIVFDAGDVFQTTVAAPKLAEAKLRLALPNLLEDQLLAEAADCHFAFLPGGEPVGAPGAAPRLPVAVINRGLLTRLLDVFAALGERARAAYSALYVLPPPTGEVLPVLATRGRLVARTERHAGIACDFDGAEPPAPLLLALRGRGWHRIRAYGSQARDLAGIAGSLGVPVDVVDRPLEADAAAGAINLLQGAFARGGLLGDFALPRLSARAWRAPLIWTAVAAGVFLAGMNAYWIKLQTEANDLRNRMATAFRSAFPESEMVDPIVQAQRELVRLRARAGQSSPGDFSVLNAQAAQLLASAPVGIVAAVDYRDAALQLKFKSPPDASLQNRLRSQAVQQGLQLTFDADGAARITAAGG